MGFKKATKEQLSLMAALLGPAGSGKSFTALRIAARLAAKEGKRVACIDSEHGSAKKYADLFDFDVLELEDFAPAKYMAAIDEAIKAEYGVIVIDSLSHAWAGKGGILEFVDAEKLRSKNKDAYGDGWRKATPQHNALVEKMLSCQGRAHLIVTMRTKMEHVRETDEHGKTRIRKVGMQPIQRDGLEYEFDVVGDLDQDNTFTVSKTRCPKLRAASIELPGDALADTLYEWLRDGVKATPPPPIQSPPSQPTQTTMVADPLDNEQRATIADVAKSAGLIVGKDASALFTLISSALGRPVASSQEIHATEYKAVMAAVEASIDADKKETTDFIFGAA
jgi:hypothetical protein